MSITNRCRIERLSLNLRMGIARRLCDGVTYQEIRADLRAVGLPEDELPSDKSFRTYQQSHEYESILEREMDALWRRNERESRSAPNREAASKTAIGGTAAGPTTAAWLTLEGTELDVQSRARLLTRLERRIVRSDALMGCLDGIMERADGWEVRLTDACLRDDLCDEDDAEADAAWLAEESRRRRSTMDGAATDLRAGPGMDGEAETAAVLEERLARESARRERKGRLKRLKRQAMLHIRQRDRLLRHPGIMRAPLYMRTLLSVMKLMDEQHAELKTLTPAARAALATQAAAAEREAAGAVLDELDQWDEADEADEAAAENEEIAEREEREDIETNDRGAAVNLATGKANEADNAAAGRQVVTAGVSDATRAAATAGAAKAVGVGVAMSQESAPAVDGVPHSAGLRRIPAPASPSALAPAPTLVPNRLAAGAVNGPARVPGVPDTAAFGRIPPSPSQSPGNTR